MKIFISHPPTRDNPASYLSADIAAAGTTLSLKNTKGFSASKFIIVGSLGFEQTEIVKITTVVDEDTITLTSPGVKFGHSADTKATFFDWDQIKVYKSTSGISGTYNLATTLDITPNFDTTVYEDTSSSSNYYYKFAPYNSITTTEGSLSDPVSANGYVFYSLKTITDRILSAFGDAYGRFVTRDEVRDAVNEIYEIGQQEMTLASDRYNIAHQDIVLENDVYEYDLDGEFFIEKAIKVSTDGGVTFPFHCLNKQLDSMGVANQANVKYGYVITDLTLRIEDRKPVAGDILRVYYIEAPTQLSGQDDLLANPFRHATGMFVKYGLSLCYLKDKKLDDYKELRDESMAMLKRQISFVKRLTNRHPQHTEVVNGIYS